MENWVFPKTSALEDVYDFVKVRLPDDLQAAKFRLATSYPKKYLLNVGESLASAGIEDHDMLIAEKM
jgi:hypothetical protein